MKSRAVLAAITIGVVLTSFGAAGWSQEFKPSRQIEAVVHTGPGGGSDIFARAIAEMLQKVKLILQRMQVGNKSGGGSGWFTAGPGFYEPYYYSYSLFGGPYYWDDWYNEPPGVIVVLPPVAHGRVVNGAGYTQVSPRPPVAAPRDVRPNRPGERSSSGSASSASSGASGSSSSSSESGSSGGASSAGYSAGSSSSDTGRTAVAR